MISVIVPIYNIENYLTKCLNSLAAQTFKDVEFILVDDGSTDKSGEIAESYTSDKRFHIFHTENRGLSAARNYGMEKAQGEYLMFVDGDDWVVPEFCMTPYTAMIQNNADMVVFQAFSPKKRKAQNNFNQMKTQTIIDKIDSFKVYETCRTVAWNKLYKKELFQGIHYPDGKVFEDVATTHKLIHAAQRIVVLSDALYCYVYRKNSISHTYLSTDREDGFIAAENRYVDLISYGFPKEEHIYKLYEFAIGYLACVNPSKEETYIRAQNIANSITGIPRLMSRKTKAALILWKINKKLFQLVFRSIKIMKA